MAFLRALLFAFCGSSAWFVWAVENQTDGSCFRAGYYVPAATIALAVVVGCEIALDALVRSTGREVSNPPLSPSTLAGGAIATAGLTMVGLLIAVNFAAAVGCSA